MYELCTTTKVMLYTHTSLKLAEGPLGFVLKYSYARPCLPSFQFQEVIAGGVVLQEDVRDSL